MGFPQRLATIRKNKKLTQQALAEAVGVHVIQIRRYEAGSCQPTLDVLRRLATTLGVSADELVFDHADRTLDEQLRIHFQRIAKFDDDEKKVVKAVLDGLVLKNEAKRWSGSS